MIIASLIVKTIPEYAEDTALKLSKLPNVSTHGIYKGDNIIVLIEAEKEEQLEDFSKYIINEFDGILGTYPTFVSSEDNLPETMN